MLDHSLPPLCVLLAARDDPHGHRDVTAAAKAALAAAKAHSARPRSTFVLAKRVVVRSASSGAWRNRWRVRWHVIQRRWALVWTVAACCVIVAFLVFHRRPPAFVNPIPATALPTVQTARPAPAAPVVVRHVQPVADPAPSTPVSVYDGRGFPPGGVPAWLASLTPAQIATWYAVPGIAPAAGVTRSVPLIATHEARAPSTVPSVASTAIRRPARRVQATLPTRRAPALPIPRVAVRPSSVPPRVAAPVDASRLTTVSMTPAPVRAAPTPVPARPSAPAPAAPKPAAYRVVTFVSSSMVLIQSTRNGKKWVSAYSVGQRLPDGRVLTGVNLARHTIETGK
ncbi:MAG TPA: hypothetical protein VFQ95_02265 [Rhodanobacteraceae bacterium]|nr:hypothetical protein [Rhodanobacteraceae bacterium]